MVCVGGGGLLLLALEELWAEETQTKGLAGWRAVLPSFLCILPPPSPPSLRGQGPRRLQGNFQMPGRGPERATRRAPTWTQTHAHPLQKGWQQVPRKYPILRLEWGEVGWEVPGWIQW